MALNRAMPGTAPPRRRPDPPAHPRMSRAEAWTWIVAALLMLLAAALAR